MWTRAELKDRAKTVLRKSYWKAFLVSLLLAFITGGVPSCSYNSNFGGKGSSHGVHFGGPSGVPDGAMTAIIIAAVMVGIIAVLSVFAFRIFLSAPLEVGVRKYFAQAAQDDVNMNYLGYSFAKGKYIEVVKGMLLRAVFNFLWFLLFFFPGIVKAYAYRMTPYILAENPHIGTRRAVELSNRMTRGHKWRMFVLDLSFIGWFLLGTIAFFVGVLFVLPYYNATQAELYLTLRRQALDAGLSSVEELNPTY
jgi:uncharacterized membrane protein